MPPTIPNLTQFGYANLSLATKSWKWSKTAKTWLSKATVSLRSAHEIDPDLSGLEPWSLAGHCVEHAEYLSRLCDDWELRSLIEQTESTLAAMKRRRLALKLDTAGRTPEEAALFEAKRAELEGKA